MSSIPLLWINLDRASRRRRRMDWAIAAGGWQGERLAAVDARDRRQRLLPLPDPLRAGADLPGLRRWQEPDPWRRTSRAELACLASWQRLIGRARERLRRCDADWILLMEDDVGASLARPAAWPHDLAALAAAAGPGVLAIQLAPISARVRVALHGIWRASGGGRLTVPKREWRSHGNGAVLLHRRALPRLETAPARWAARHAPRWHPLLHPWRVRPVADKWLYACLPADACHVATFPLFCLEAEDSALHPEHVDAFHRPSRQATLAIWEEEGCTGLLDAQRIWEGTG
jgi:hypothetical protein